MKSLSYESETYRSKYELSFSLIPAYVLYVSLTTMSANMSRNNGHMISMTDHVISETYHQNMG